MSFRLDARIPVLPGPGGDDERAAWLVEEGHNAPDHAIVVESFAPGLPTHTAGCTCCTPRVPIAEALRRLFLARAKGPFFPIVRIATSSDGEVAVRHVLANDPMIAAWFRAG